MAPTVTRLLSLLNHAAIPTDEDDNLSYTPGDCALREAIRFANPDDTIRFDSSLAGQTIGLTLGQLTIDKNLTIVGLDATHLAISGENASRILQIDAGASVSISGLTFKNGSATVADYSFLSVYGGAILNSGTLSVNDSTFSFNECNGRGGAIFVHENGVLTAERCQFLDNKALNDGNGAAGGAVGLNSPSTAAVIDSLFRNNVAECGGAIIQNYSSRLDIRGSTFDSNRALIEGGAISTDSAELYVTNSTFVGNFATPSDVRGGGAIRNSAGFCKLISTTITANSGTLGGGILSYGTTVLWNTIVAGNTQTQSGGDPSNVDGSLDVTNAWNNLIGVGGSGGLADGSQGNRVGIADPGLLPLADNGGPTPTIALAAGSPAINAGSNALAVGTDGLPLAYDQRGPGFPRVVDGQIDIGAFEGVASQINHPPVADDFAVTASATAVTVPVLIHASDPDGDALQVLHVSQGTNGTVVVNPDGTVTYTLTRLLSSTDSFTYTVSDGHGETATGTVTINLDLPAVEQINVLQTQVQNLNIASGQKAALTAELRIAQVLAERFPRLAALDLQLFQVHVRLLRRLGRIDAATADLLIGEAQVLIGQLT